MLPCSWNVVVVDGHDVSALAKALEDTKSITGKPCAVLGKTFKGRGVPGKVHPQPWNPILEPQKCSSKIFKDKLVKVVQN